MKLYDELAAWWPVFADHSQYRLEAAHFTRVIRSSTRPVAKTVLELGSGGGSSASHLKASFTMTLVDLSAPMLRVSRKLNPECRHVRGDIRNIRLGQTFDAVFVHDAVCHMTNEQDLAAVMRTAFEHCRPGGAALFVPDFVTETFEPGTDTGGGDAKGASLRFLQWTVDPDPADSTYVIDFAILLRDRRGKVRVAHDRHVLGLFRRARWLRLLRDAGFVPAVVRDRQIRESFLARRPGQRPGSRGSVSAPASRAGRRRRPHP